MEREREKHLSERVTLTSYLLPRPEIEPITFWHMERYSSPLSHPARARVLFFCPFFLTHFLSLALPPKSHFPMLPSCLLSSRWDAEVRGDQKGGACLTDFSSVPVGCVFTAAFWKFSANEERLRHTSSLATVGVGLTWTLVPPEATKLCCLSSLATNCWPILRS